MTPAKQPKNLYHGTTSAVLDSILTNGLIPRGNKASNWDGGAQSNPEFVYLTSTYPGYFAPIAIDQQRGDLMLIVEVNVSSLDSANLYPDEDLFAAQLRSEHGGFTNALRTQSRQLAIENQSMWLQSVHTFGSCAHRGTIPLPAITRYVTVDHRIRARICHDMLEPVINPMAFIARGPYYQEVVAWLFGDLPEHPGVQQARREVELWHDAPEPIDSSYETHLANWEMESSNRNGILVCDVN